MKDDLKRTNEPMSEEVTPSHISRRTFLKVAMTSAGLATVGVACNPLETAQQGTVSGPADTSAIISHHYPEVPDTPLEPPDVDILNFFTLHEAQTVEAITARILPGTPDDPGAREARVVVYIDKLLSYDQGFAEPIYRLAPYAETYEGDSPSGTATSEVYQVIWVQQDQLPRYGYQSALNAREIYRVGLRALDVYANARFGSDFIDLSEAQQDQIVGEMAEDDDAQAGASQPAQDAESGANGSGEGGEQSSQNQISNFFTEPSATSFFEMLHEHTIQGMFCDPVYGGNRNMVGWKLINYPGAQRAYTEREMQTEAIQREPQSIVNLPHFHPGQPAGGQTVIPVSGPTERDQEVRSGQNILQRLFGQESEQEK